MKLNQILTLFFLSCFSFTAFAFTVDSLSTIEDYLTHNSIDAKEGPDGLFYTLDVEGKGASPQAGDYIKVKYTGRLLNGNVFDQSEKNNPFIFQLGYRVVIQGWEKGIPLFPVGSKGSLFVPPHLAYGKSGLGSIPPNSPLVFDLEIVDILTIQEYDQYMIEVERKERQAYEDHIKNQFKADKKVLHNYAADNKIKAKRTDSGMSYSITKKGKGELAKPGDIIEVHYEGFLMDGQEFDSSYKRKETYQFVLGRGKVIQGWDEGIQYFNKGSQGWLLIPSKLAYGPMAIKEDDIDIPGDSALAFKIKVIDIKSPSAGK